MKIESEVVWSRGRKVKKKKGSNRSIDRRVTWHENGEKEKEEI